MCIVFPQAKTSSGILIVAIGYFLTLNTNFLGFVVLQEEKAQVAN